VAQTAGGDQVRMRPGGRPADVRLAGSNTAIHHGLNGQSRVEAIHGDRRIVAERGVRGFVERPYRYGGREYGHRTYYYNGRAYDRFYHGYPYHGVYVSMYTPVYYYPPGFYGWAYNPWVAPVPYAWGWAGNPWYGYYGAYFTPYPVYPSASVWLTDYLISNTLAASYQARMEAGAAAQGPAPQQQFAADAAPLTPQVKDLIAAEVQRQIAVENAEAQPAAQNAPPNPAMSGVQAMFTDNVQHVFVTGRSIDVTDSNQAECAISEGDALQLAGKPAPNATAVNLVMLSSKGGQECKAGATVLVPVTDLQDMQNHMRETIDTGLSELQTKQATSGLPPLPPSAKGAPVKAAFAAAAPGPDATAGNEIAQQYHEATQREAAVVGQVQPAAGSMVAPVMAISVLAVAPPEVKLGQSVEEVSRMLGQPASTVNLGDKQIYVYPKIKITFLKGKVSIVE